MKCVVSICIDLDVNVRNNGAYYTCKVVGWLTTLKQWLFHWVQWLGVRLITDCLSNCFAQLRDGLAESAELKTV